MGQLCELWIDIEDAEGTKLGAGPIRTAYVWMAHPRLDNAGDFTFEMPAGDPKTALLVNKRVARCSTVIDGTVTELGAGIIEDIGRMVSAAQAGPVRRVRGGDLLSELGWRSVEELRICELGWTYLDAGKGSVRRVPNAIGTDEEDLPEAYDGNPGTATDPFEMRDNWWLYIGHDARFNQVGIDLGTTNDDEATTLQYQYFSSEQEWRDLEGISDGTIVSGRPFGQDGDIAFTRPADWERVAPTEASGEWLWIRMRRTPEVGNNFTVTLAEVEVYADVPTLDGVNLIMAYAPDTWTTTGYPPTVAAKYLEFHGESVLAALRMLAEQGGQEDDAAIREHFRLIHSSDAGYPAGGREIVWLGTDAPASGIRAVRVQDAVAFEGVGAACAIVSLTERLDTSDAISRIMPYSLDGLTLAATTRVAPTGYTLDAAANYIRRDQAETDLGRIEEVRRFTDIEVQQSDSPAVHAQYVADALFDRALEYLRTHSAVNRFYDLDTTKVLGAVLPGETLDVVYHDYADGYHSIDIDTVVSGEPLRVLGTVITVDQAGVHTVGFEVGTIDRERVTDGGLIVSTIQDVRRLRAAVGGAAVALTGLGASGPVAGVDIAVEGRVVNRKGNVVLLFSGAGANLMEFAFSSAGLDLALAAAATGDVVLLPAGTIAGDHTVDAGVEVIGRGRAGTILNGKMTLGNGALLRDLSVTRSAAQAGDLIGVVAPVSGMAYVIGCDLVVNNATGDGFALYGDLAHMTARWCSLNAQSAGVDSNPFKRLL